jgi:hypothetical protein
VKNTRIEYLYRDAGNYKAWGSVVVAGEFTFESVEPYFNDHGCFIASQVGLPDPQWYWRSNGYRFPTEDDDVWCELEADGCEPTDDPPTCDLTAAELAARFKQASEEGWDEARASAHSGQNGLAR